MFTACVPKGLRGLITTDEAKAYERMKQIMEVMKNKDKEGLKAMFSKQALKDVNSFDHNMDLCLSFFKVMLYHGNKGIGCLPTRILKILKSL